MDLVLTWFGWCLCWCWCRIAGDWSEGNRRTFVSMWSGTLLVRRLIPIRCNFHCLIQLYRIIVLNFNYTPQISLLRRNLEEVLMHLIKRQTGNFTLSFERNFITGLSRISATVYGCQFAYIVYTLFSTIYIYIFRTWIFWLIFKWALVLKPYSYATRVAWKSDGLVLCYKTGWRGLTFEEKFYFLLFLKEMHV